jgi:hypothetical protein
LALRWLRLRLLDNHVKDCNIDLGEGVSNFVGLAIVRMQMNPQFEVGLNDMLGP